MRAPHLARLLSGILCVGALTPACGKQPTTRTAVSFPDDPVMQNLADRVLATLEVNRRRFEGRSGPVEGFAAGSAYPQMWLRDNATLIPATRLFWPEPILVSWLEEHLSFQAPNGMLYDWLGAGTLEVFSRHAPRARQVFAKPGVSLVADRNTTEMDQESSAVLAAHEIYRATGRRDWLLEVIDGVPLIERLDRALSFVHREHRDAADGLIRSAFTADWGDVSPTYPDQRAIYADEGTPLAHGLYTNAMFYAACRALADLFEASGSRDRAAYWREIAADMKRLSDERLWDESRDFYRVHGRIQAGAVIYDDRNVFALGGNAIAALYGLATAKQAARIFAAAEARRRSGVTATVAGVLVPPYPEGVFKHPILSRPYTYQNGGQWDWFAGRLILAEFERGETQRAIRHLTEIAHRVRAADGLYEWFTPEGHGRGSSDYAGSAGALGAALFHGLLGAGGSPEEPLRAIRLGTKPADVTIFEPATSRRAAYRYRFDPTTGSLILRYRVEAARGQWPLRVWIPPESGIIRDVCVGIRSATYSVDVVGKDRYVHASVPSGQHTVQIRPVAGCPSPAEEHQPTVSDARLTRPQVPTSGC